MTRKKRTDSVKSLIKLLDSNPELADRLVESLTDSTKKDQAVDSSPAPRVNAPSLHDVVTGKVELEKGPIVQDVYVGLTVCAICGKDQKTYTPNPKGQVTQRVCSPCSNRMSAMQPKERKDFMDRAMNQEYLSAAEAKFRVMQRNFEKKRVEEKREFGDQEFKVNPNESK